MASVRYGYSNPSRQDSPYYCPARLVQQQHPYIDHLRVQSRILRGIVQENARTIALSTSHMLSRGISGIGNKYQHE